jgi:hypothetical protein
MNTHDSIFRSMSNLAEHVCAYKILYSTAQSTYVCTTKSEEQLSSFVFLPNLWQKEFSFPTVEEMRLEGLLWRRQCQRHHHIVTTFKTFIPPSYDLKAVGVLLKRLKSILGRELWSQSYDHYIYNCNTGVVHRRRLGIYENEVLFLFSKSTS